MLIRQTPKLWWKWPYEGRFRKRVVELAESKDWQLARIKGSHHGYIHDDRIERFVIPIHSNRTLKIGLQGALMKIIPLQEDEF